MKLINKLKDMGKGKMLVKKIFFKEYKLFLIKIPTLEPGPDPTPEPVVFD